MEATVTLENGSKKTVTAENAEELKKKINKALFPEKIEKIERPETLGI